MRSARVLLWFVAGPGGAWLGGSRLGVALRGTARIGLSIWDYETARKGVARLGGALRGRAWTGADRRGNAKQGRDWFINLVVGRG